MREVIEMSDAKQPAGAQPATDPLWRATVEMADHALDPDIDEDSSLEEDDLPRLSP
jgi:hypothetical protein